VRLDQRSDAEDDGADRHRRLAALDLAESVGVANIRAMALP
jgi:hypothetical protein